VNLDELPSPEEDLDKHLVPDAPKDEALLQRTLMSLEFLEDLDEASVAELVNGMQVYAFSDGDQVIRQGDTDGSHFFIVAEGEFEMTTKDEAASTRSIITAGSTFGESVLLLFGSRRASVIAKGDNAKLYGMEGVLVRETLVRLYEQRHMVVVRAVDDILNSGACYLLQQDQMTSHQLQTLYDEAVLCEWKDGEEIPADAAQSTTEVHILVSGHMQIYGKLKDQITSCDLRVKPHDLRQYSLVGDYGMLYGDVPVVAHAKGRAQTLMLGRRLLEELFEPQLAPLLVKNLLLAALERHRVFSKVSSQQRATLVSRCEVKTLYPEEELEGADDVRFALCICGEVEACLVEDGPSPEMSSHRPFCDDTIGDEFVLQQTTKPTVWPYRIRATSTRAITKIALWHNQDVDAVVSLEGLDVILWQDRKVKVLRKVYIFRTLSQSQLRELAEAIQIDHFRSGSEVFKQGAEGREFCIIRRGTVLVEKDGHKIRTLGKGDYFGERALLEREPRSATVTCEEDCEIWKIGIDVFQEIMHGDIRDYLKDRMALQDSHLTLADLRLIRIIGRGGFGVVRMVQSRQTAVRYALKSVRKHYVVQRNQQEQLVAERNILAEVDHPFIIKFVRAFVSKHCVHFLMELVSGGELFAALEELGLLGRSQAQFYAGSLLLALEYLHERRVAYLDLKSENCLIDHQGYLKLIDFGIARKITGVREHVVKGTPMFMAPEMILGKGYNTHADLWSLGVCIYEFMIGEFPFGNCPTNKEEETLLFRKILKAPLRFPGWFERQPDSEDSMALIRGLLTRDPAKRAGAGFAGYNNLKGHAFFSDFSFDALLSRGIVPPYLPQGEVYAEPGPESTRGSADGSSAAGDEEGGLSDVTDFDDEEDLDSGWVKDFDC